MGRFCCIVLETMHPFIDCSRGKIGARSPVIGRQATFASGCSSANYQSIEAKYEALDSCNQFLKEEVNNHQDLVS